MWRDQRLMLRLQRGEPVVFIHPDDARARGIADHDLVRVGNDIGAFEARAKIAPPMRPGQVHIYHAWEPFQFRGWHGPHEPIASLWKPIHLVGDYGQLHYRMYYAAPGSTRGTTVEVTRINLVGPRCAESARAAFWSRPALRGTCGGRRGGTLRRTGGPQAGTSPGGARHCKEELR
jgi:nitrate reductase alpha subunit